MTCDSTPIEFSAFAVDMCFTEASFTTDDSYYSYGYYSSATTSPIDTLSSSTHQKLVSNAISKLKSYNAESVGTSYYYYSGIGPLEWSCYNPNTNNDKYYYYYGNNSTSSMVAARSSKPSQRTKSQSLLTPSYTYSCPPYTATNTSNAIQNYASCYYGYGGDKPLIVTGILLSVLV
jgi:hypothetical protein